MTVTHEQISYPQDYNTANMISSDENCAFSEQCPGKMKRYFEGRLNCRLKEYNITSAYVPYILIISKNDGISLKDLTRIIGLDRAHTTRMMSKLSEHGLAEDLNPDGREYNVHLTVKGKEMECIIRTETNEIMNSLLSCLSDDEKKVWNKLWCKINAQMDDHTVD